MSFDWASAKGDDSEAGYCLPIDHAEFAKACQRRVEQRHGSAADELEYVADWWHRLSYKESPLNDPTGPAEQSEQQDFCRSCLSNLSFMTAKGASQRRVCEGMMESRR